MNRFINTGQNTLCIKVMSKQPHYESGGFAAILPKLLVACSLRSDRPEGRLRQFDGSVAAAM